MGREVRRVPPNWNHPVVDRDNGRPGKQPMHNRSYADARAEWLDGLRRWEAGEDPAREEYKNDDGTTQDYWEWHGEPPDRACYRPWNDSDATWFQLWETVSEGTPVSPPFETKEELAQYLAANGDEWDQSRCGEPGWGIARARAFVEAGWAPSMMVMAGQVYESKDIPLANKAEE